MSDRPPRTESELIEFVRAIDVPAPDTLRRSTERLVAERSAGAGSGRARRGPAAARTPLALRAGAASALLAAAIAVVLVVSLAGSASPAKSLPSQVAALTLRGATSAAPAESHRRRDQLVASVEGLAFPYWSELFGWSSSGSRADRIGGRAVSTVFYRDGSGQRIGYAILAGAAPSGIGGGTVVWRGGTPYRLQVDRASRAVVWQRDGHLCVVAGRGVSSATLLRLASWDEHGAAA